jgi:uncharacterized damage-inducible protein DinB
MKCEAERVCKFYGGAMDSKEKEQLIVDAGLSKEPEIGRWLWALQECRERTMREVAQLTPEMVDWLPAGYTSSAGTILYHMADIEADWLYVEVLEGKTPPEVTALFPFPTRDAEGHLTQVTGFTLDEHLRRLEHVRVLLLGVFQQMTLSDLRRIRSLPNYDVTPEWVLHHLMQHEAEHRGQLGTLRAAAEHYFAPAEK